ncbi:HAD family phosphatase [Pseudomonas sp. 2FE]|uniref:HAD family phosphatase n=1 Tax=Pseudomonas sp. 2FE TaxID=2502190 RepID=UPI0010F5F0ED|nr:HAD family phosphatase [Pseudomonas sp. 2FE]
MPPLAIPSPAFTAVLFGLSGCLVDFGARTLPVTLLRLRPDAASQRLPTQFAPATALAVVLGRDPQPAELLGLNQALVETASEHAEVTPGALALLDQLQQQGVPCAWLDELPCDAGTRLATPLPSWLHAAQLCNSRPWPAPDACWQTLMELKVANLDGCVLISGEPRLLQAGLNAGLWTVGLAACGPLCGQAPADWQALPARERDQLRAQATLELYRLGVHSVVDHLAELGPSLADLAMRRQKGEKP